MLAQAEYLDLAALDDDGSLVSDDVEQEITKLLQARAPELSSKNSFRIASSLIDTAVAKISTLQSQVATLRAERDKLSSQEADWEGLLSKWRDVTIGLKGQIRDLESRLAEANQRTVRAELRAQNAEDDAINSQKGSFDLCDKVIAAFGSGALADSMGMATRDVAGSC